MTANLVNACIQAAALKRQISITHALISDQKALLAALRRAFAAGQAARGDVLVQETAVAQAEASAPPLEKQAGVERDLIQALAGGFPAEDLAKAIELTDLTLPTDLPAAVPARLVEQRPDIRAAEANLRVASAAVGVAMAARLPSVQITGAVGGEAGNLGQLLSPGGLLWDIVAGASQPVFEGGALRHRQRAAEAAYDQARAQYRGVVIGGLQNLADALRALQSDADALKISAEAEHTASETLAVSERQAQSGEAALSVRLTAQVNYEQTALTLVQARAARFADTVAFYQALGGGWWNRDDGP
jgi:NodT family efflux transporter outer membrane factor (OMF) lipoprotein